MKNIELIENKNKNIKSGQKSSKIVYDFLEKNNLHKKEFAQMIGVTLSYVDNLIDENFPFSSRSTTLERIATVMDINPEEFMEYQIPSDVPIINSNTLLIKDFIKHNKMSTVDFLKKFERKKRLNLVDILRGVKNLPIDYSELRQIAEVLNMDEDKFFALWKDVMVQYLKEGGFDVNRNKLIIEKMFENLA